MSVSSTPDPNGSSSLRVSGHTKCPGLSCLFGRRPLAALALTAAALAFLAPHTYVAQESSAKLELKTSAFPPGANIPKQFACSGADVSPALTWSDPPPHTRSLALIMDDPDAPIGTFVHWVVYNLPASARQLPAGVPGNHEIPGGGKQGVNDFPKTGYGGPCPPPGKPHRYFFRLYALDNQLDLNGAVHRKDVDHAMKGHVLAHGELMGVYRR
ncbi:MAG: YbhB/YbcL family Raf kinase inhibitor-like protein [Terriglobia bacterium]